MLSHCFQNLRAHGAALSLFALPLLMAGCGGQPGESPAPAPGLGEADPAAVTTQTTTITSPTLTPAAASTPAAAADGQALQTVVARSDFGPMTLEDILHYTTEAQVEPLRTLQGTRNQVADQLVKMSHDQLTTAAAWIVSRLAAAQDFAQNATPKQKTDYEGLFAARYRKAVILRHVLETQIGDKLPRPTEAELQEYYDKHKAEYRVPFRFNMIHLILLTYTPYVVAEGDTLESIAERISGDVAKADEIRADLPARPLRREPDKEFKPLSPGEKLLVPMDEDQAAAVRARLEELLIKLDEGVTFKQLSAEFSQAENAGEAVGPLPEGTRPILPQLLQYGQELDAGQVSPIFRTKHGWQVIQVTDKSPEHYRTLDEMRPTILEEIVGQTQTRLTTELSTRIFENPNLKIDYETIKKGDELTSDTVIATVGEQQLLWSQYEGLWKQQGRPRIDGGIKDTMTQLRPLQEMLLLDLASDQLKDPNSPLNASLTRAHQLNMGQTWISTLATRQLGDEVTTDTMRKLYEEIKETAFPARPEVKFVSMERRLDAAQRQLPDDQKQAALMDLFSQMQSDLQGIQTPEAFQQKAAEVNSLLEDPQTPPPSSADFVPVQTLAGPLQSVLERLNVNEWSRPILMEKDRLVSLMVTERRVEGVQPFEEVEGLVQRIQIEQVMNKTLNDLRDRFMNAAHFEAVAPQAS